MEDLLITTEIIAATLLSFILALAIEPLLVMAVLGLAKKAAQRRPPHPPRETPVAELRLLATGPKNSSQD
jgi:hypothetical protein